MASLWERIRALLGGSARTGAEQDDRAFYYYLLCGKCRTPLRVRVSKTTELAEEYEGPGDGVSGYVLNKDVICTKCFRRIHLTITYTAARREKHREITGGTFLEPEEYFQLTGAPRP